MKNHIKALVSIAAVAALCGTAQAQVLNGWGHDSDAVNGTTIVDSGSGGNFTVSGTPTGSSTFRASLASAITLGIGGSLSVSGALSWPTAGAMGGGGLRLGFMNYTALGTVSGVNPTWSTASTTATSSYFWGLPTGGTGIGNPAGGEISGHNIGGGGSGWFSGNGGGYAVPNTIAPATYNNNPANMIPGTYNFSLTLTRSSATALQIGYSMVQTAGGTYSEIGTVTDSSANAAFTFNAFGFFANTSDTAFGSTVSLSGVTETVTVPEPSSIALLGLGALVGVFVIRRRNS